MHRQRRTLKTAAFFACALGGALLWNATAQAGQRLNVVDSKRLDLTVGKSIVIETPVPIGRASLADSEVADALVLSPRQIYVSGRRIGGTNLTLWKQNDEIYSVFDIGVAPDLAGLKAQLHELFPGESGIEVTAAFDHVALGGIISSPMKLQRALAVAEAYAPEKVVNLLRVGGVQQVMLEVRVAEMSRSLIRRLGVNLGYAGNNATDFGVTTLNDLAAVVPSRDATLLPALDTTGASAVPFGLVPVAANTILRWQAGGADWTAFIDALKEQGLVSVMAEPNLVALSGQEASFLAGGEFPYPVPQTLGTVTIEFKEFGVGLQFTPTVLGDDLISIRVAPEVSELDFSNAITISGFLIPAITTRRVQTVVELRDGQTFAIAGLIQQSIRESIDKFPVLGEVPVLGALFRSSDFQKNESELIVVVTPHLVKPLEKGRQHVLPTDGLIQQTDFDAYMLGELTTTGFQKVEGVSASEASLEGEFGTVAP